jgi:serine/threonine protein kinase
MDPQETLNIYESMHSGLGDILQTDDSQTNNRNPENPLDFSSPDCRYQTPESLSSGGMKHIYKTYDKLCGRQVAMAILKNIRSQQDLEQFTRESTITARLEHPNIMPIYDIGHDDKGEPFFTMPLLTGENLADLIRRESQQNIESPALALKNKINMFLKICDAISYAHSRDVIHLDLKPENIQTGPFGELLVCDWGLAYKLDSKKELKVNRIVCGTPGFIAPELKISKVFDPSPRCDVYSLGVLLKCLISLRGPLDPNFQKDPEHTPNGLLSIINKAMTEDPEMRYQAVHLLKQDLENWINGFAPSSQAAGQGTVFLLFCKRNLRTIFFCTVFACILSLTLHYKNINTQLSHKLSHTLSDTNTQPDLVDTSFILDRHYKLLYNFKTKEAESLISQALVYTPNDKKILKLAAISHICNLNFRMASWKLSALDERYQPMAKLCRSMSNDAQALNKNNLIKIYTFLEQEKLSLAMSNLSHSLKDKISLEERQTLFTLLLRQLNKYVDKVEIQANKLKIHGKSPLSNLSPLMLNDFDTIDISAIGTDDINELVFLAPEKLMINLLTYSKFSHELQNTQYEVIK